MEEKTSIDLATIVGLILGVGSIVTAIYLEFNELNPKTGSVFLQLSALMIIFGGTSGCTMIGYPLKEFMKIPRLLGIAMFSTETDPAEMVNTIVKLAELARREGVLRLESEIASFQESNPFLAKGIRFVVDGTEPQTVEDMLYAELDTMAERHKVGQTLFTAAGGFAPTMGIVGTVVGLINALSKAGEGGGDPSAVVSAIASAFIATFYGIGMANLIILPLAGKLKTRSEEEIFMKRVVVEAILNLQRGENPRLIYEKLRVLFQKGTIKEMAGKKE